MSESLRGKGEGEKFNMSKNREEIQLQTSSSYLHMTYFPCWGLFMTSDESDESMKLKIWPKPIKLIQRLYRSKNEIGKNRKKWKIKTGKKLALRKYEEGKKFGFLAKIFTFVASIKFHVYKKNNFLNFSFIIIKR